MNRILVCDGMEADDREKRVTVDGDLFKITLSLPKHQDISR